MKTTRVYEATDSSKIKLIAKLSKLLDIDSEEAESFLIKNDWDLEEAAASAESSGKKKKPKEKKIFKPGDVVICIDAKPGKLPPDCVDFLTTYKYFKVRDVNDKLNIDLGHKLVENGNIYYFAPNRFELKDGISPKKVEASKVSPLADSSKENILKNQSDFLKKAGAGKPWIVGDKEGGPSFIADDDDEWK